MRAPGAILSTVALLLGFLEAPFFHIHPEDFDHPASATPTHMHVRLAAAAPGSVLGGLAADDDAVDVEWGIARVSPVSLAVDFAVGEAIAIPASVPVSTPIRTPQQRAHDPPAIAPKQPRAPPA